MSAMAYNERRVEAEKQAVNEKVAGLKTRQKAMEVEHKTAMSQIQMQIDALEPKPKAKPKSKKK